ncbi:MAG TPA: alginate lyase family protein [Candidatus Aquilonibacter sp.]|nr:alginate lyase family protein [Candidatus Aquilonibacter sp.]
MGPPLTRRNFLALTSAALTSHLLYAQNAPNVPTARINVADAERPRILSEAPHALAAPVTPITSSPAPHAPANTFVSEIEPERGVSDPHASAKLFRTHAVALRNTSVNIACLSAAYLLTHDEQYAHRAGAHLRAWFITPATRMLPNADLAGREYGSETGTPAGIVDLAPLAELIRSTSFLVDSQALAEDEFDALNQWFADFASWLDTNRSAGIARDAKDHRASAWLLIRSAIARSARSDADLEACRKRFRAPTLRNQINEAGIFPQEVATPNPYRNTLFNFDLLAGACQLLDSPFDLLWEYQLIDEVGMRSVAAYLYPLILDPEKWPYVADADHFMELPGPRPALLFAGRAYERPEYVALWRKLDSQPVPEDIAGSFPIRQPLLWTERAAHGY